MALDVETVGGVRVITLEGESLDGSCAGSEARFRRVCSGTPRPALMNMSGVRYVSSYLVGVLVDLHFEALHSRFPDAAFPAWTPGIGCVLEVRDLRTCSISTSRVPRGFAALSGGPAATTR